MRCRRAEFSSKKDTGDWGYVICSFLQPLNHAAADFGAGIARGLCGKIVFVVVDDQGFSDDFRECQAAVIEEGPGIAGFRKQGHKVTGMVWMLLFFGVIVCSGLVKRPGAVAVFVDVHAKEAGRIREASVRQMKGLHLDVDAAGWAWIKECKPVKVWIFSVSQNVCKGSRAHKRKMPAAGFCLWIHKITSQ